MKMKQLVQMVRRLRIQGGVVKHIDGVMEDIVTPRFALVTIREDGVKHKRFCPVESEDKSRLYVHLVLTPNHSGTIVYYVSETESRQQVDLKERIDFVI